MKKTQENSSQEERKARKSYGNRARFLNATDSRGWIEVAKRPGARCNVKVIAVGIWIHCM